MPDVWQTLDELVGECFKLASEAKLAVNAYPDFHIALNDANLALRRRGNDPTAADK